ncbi:alpha/beta hydrolase family protein [Streptomyces sp. NPDC054794]
MSATMARGDEGPGAALLAALRSAPRVRVAHRHGSGLLVEADLDRAHRPTPVPFVLRYAARADGGPTLRHGCEDPHVPAAEARAMYRSLDGHGVPVELMLLPGEAHSIRRPDNLTTWLRWILRACRSVLGTPYPPEEALTR